MTVEIIQSGILQGLVLSIIAFGIMIPFRFLDFPDLTAEGAYPLGGAICSTLMIAEFPVSIAILAGVLGAGMMAIATSQVCIRLKVDSLLAGIILSTMIYSVNLRIMKKPNISLFNHVGFNFNILSLIIILLLCMTLFSLFLYTDFGLRFRAVGLNADFIKKQGVNINNYTVLGLFIAGCLFGLAGSLIVQIQSYMDVGMGVGIVIHGLASLMIGEVILGNNTLLKQIIAPVVGAIIYQQIQGFALSFGIAPSDLKFFTGSIVLFFIAIQKNVIVLSK